MLGPKVTYVTNSGAKVSFRVSLLLWIFNRKFAKQFRDMIYKPWEDGSDFVNLTNRGSLTQSSVRVKISEMALLRLSWF